jgi:hypothetical protein
LLSCSPHAMRDGWSRITQALHPGYWKAAVAGRRL